MSQAKFLTLCLSLIGSVFIVVAAVAFRESSQIVKGPESSRAISQQELESANGKDGNSCYVAVENVVYEIKNSLYWRNGEHVPSEGQAYCGRDLTEAIKRAPHGTTKLSLLTKIGTLE